jgi:serine/threonine protein kinase
MGKYVVDGLLGPGGVTETYLAHVEADAKPGASVELCALKLLRGDRVPEGSFARVAARFLSAGRQLRDFHRPGFCRVIDICEDPSATFVVSQYLPGCDLGRLLETCRAEGKQGVHPALAALLGSEIARLLHVGHSAKPAFAHLGLCLQNVIVAASGDVTLLDAGIAASLRAITEQPAERWALVAPELGGVDTGAAPLGERAAVAADLYSLGALLFLMLAGSPPNPASETGATMDVPEIPGLTSRFALILRRLLSRQADDRPEDAATLAEWLGAEAGPVRERRRLIAEGIRAVEKGIRVSSPELPAILSEPSRRPRALETPIASTAGRSPTPSGRLRILGVVALAALACAAAVLIAFGWPAKQDSCPLPRKVLEGPRGSQNVEMPQPERQPSGGPTGDNAVGGQATAAPQAPDSLLARVAGHLVVETVPPGAMVWVDGVFKGKTFADIVVGSGGHRVVVIAPGHRVFRDVFDTSNGIIIRRTLPEIPPPVRGNGFVEVGCRTADRFPVLLDDEETGLLCPARLATSSGKHTVGIFVPSEQRTVAVETTVGAGSSPAKVVFSQ